jgi:hypothetical protein
MAYFFRVIPPVPLSIKKMEIASIVKKSNGGYLITKEKRSWSDFYENWNNVFYKKKKEKVYIFVSVFAPKGLKTTIFHHWKFFDVFKDEWVSVQKIKYNIIGGRDGGYRGFSFLSNAKNGKWRVDIESESNFLIGRKSFVVKNTDKVLILENKILK